MILHKTVPAWLEKIPILDISVNHFRAVTTDVPQTELGTSETIPPPQNHMQRVLTHTDKRSTPQCIHFTCDCGSINNSSVMAGNDSRLIRSGSASHPARVYSNRDRWAVNYLINNNKKKILLLLVTEAGFERKVFTFQRFQSRLAANASTLFCVKLCSIFHNFPHFGF